MCWIDDRCRPHDGTVNISTAPAVPRVAGVDHLGRTVLTAVVPTVWGTTYVVTTHLLPDGHPFFAALLRSLPAGLIALLVSRRLPSGSWWWRSAVLGVLNMGAFFPLLFIAAQHLPGGVAATLGAGQPLIVAALAVALLGESWSVSRLLAGALGLVGVGLVVLGPGAGADLAGVLAGLVGASATGAGLVLTKRWGLPRGVGVVAFAGWQLTAAGVLLLVPGLWLDGVPPDLGASAAVGYAWLGLIGALVTYPLWFAGIRELPVTSTALLILLSPLVAAALGTLVAGESLTAVQVLGFGVALTAMVAGQLSSSTTKGRVAS